MLYPIALRARTNSIAHLTSRYPERVSTSGKHEENEVKIAVANAAKTRALLRAAGFRISARRVFEQNIVLDQPDGGVRASGRLLRVRLTGRNVTCTYKGPYLPGPHKRREEREFTAGNLDDCLALFAGLGYHPSWRYEKYRTEFRREGEQGLALLDETPIGCFLELEGNARWLDTTAKELGFSPDAYILLSYARLHAQWCAEYDLPPGDMAFQPAATQPGRKTKSPRGKR